MPSWLEFSSNRSAGSSPGDVALSAEKCAAAAASLKVQICSTAASIACARRLAACVEVPY